MNGPAWCSDVMLSYGEARWIGVGMTNIQNSKWVVLFTRKTYYGTLEEYSLVGHLCDSRTQAFFVGSLQECFNFCKDYANHEVGWERTDSSFLRLRREYHADLFSKECADEEGGVTRETLSLDMILV